MNNLTIMNAFFIVDVTHGTDLDGIKDIKNTKIMNNAARDSNIAYLLVSVDNYNRIIANGN